MHAYKVLFLVDSENFVFCGCDSSDHMEQYGKNWLSFGIFRNINWITFFSSSGS